VRGGAPIGRLHPDAPRICPRVMTVDLLIRASRDEHDRLDGTVRQAGATEAHAFSGTLELLRVLELLVPTGGAPRREEEARWTDGSS
jgi:hypothetical protein